MVAARSVANFASRLGASHAECRQAPVLATLPVESPCSAADRGRRRGRGPSTRLFREPHAQSATRADPLQKIIANRYGGRNLPVTLVLPDGGRVTLSSDAEIEILAR